MILLGISILIVSANCALVPTEEPARSGKFMPFQYDGHDMFSDVLDEVNDPLSSAEGGSRRNGTLNDPFQGMRPVYRPGDEAGEAIEGGGKNLIREDAKGSEHATSEDGNFSAAKPVTDSEIILYEGHRYQYGEPVGEDFKSENGTKEMKIFWNSVTDAIENIPFLPVQVNVPDMISAMATFLSSSIPIINRFTNQNSPRVPGEEGDGTNATFIDNYNSNQYGSNTLNDNVMEDRQLKSNVRQRERLPDKRRKDKRRQKNNRRNNRRGATKGIINRPLLRRTTEQPPEDTKFWTTITGGDRNRPNLKNMPITRKKFHMTDREVFNFKNSDITNSPIMILNIPSRPMVYYKTKVHQAVGHGDKSDTNNAPDSDDANNQTVSYYDTGKAEARGNSKSPSKSSPPSKPSPSKRVRNNGKGKGRETPADKSKPK